MFRREVAPVSAEASGGAATTPIALMWRRTLASVFVISFHTIELIWFLFLWRVVHIANYVYNPPDGIILFRNPHFEFLLDWVLDMGDGAILIYYFICLFRDMGAIKNQYSSPTLGK